MALYPEIQKKAQAEIDTVVGSHPLPDFEDHPSLPYVNAIIKESSRRIMKLFPTCLLTMMSMVVAIFRKGRSSSVVQWPV